MRKSLLCGVLLIAACRTSTTEERLPAPVPAAAPAAVSNLPGAPSPRLAVDAFLAAIRAQDLQAMSAVWGDKTGPARDARVMTRQDMEQRELYLIRCLKHDTFRVLGESPGTDGERVFQVELTKGTLSRVTDFYTALGADRWYVRNVNLSPTGDLCKAAS